MATQTTDCALLCACGVSYNIGGDLSQNPYFSGAGFSANNQPMVIGTDPAIATCIMGTTPAGVVIAFTGTIATSDLSWLTDFIMLPVTSDGYPGKVHVGWLSCFDILKSQIDSTLDTLLQTNPNAQIFITGHSKGGAMASIAAWYLSNVRDNPIPASQITVTTFASPAPGDADFAAGYKAIFSQTNYINYMDMVPFLPPSEFTSGFWADIFSELSAIALKNGDTELSKILGDIATVLTVSAGWDYTAVSTTDMFIKEDGSVSDSPLWYPVFYAVVTSNLLTGNLDEVLAAHSHLCGGGYMNGVCQGLCTQ